VVHTVTTGIGDPRKSQ